MVNASAVNQINQEQLLQPELLLELEISSESFSSV
jgi:hypothetical protein